MNALLIVFRRVRNATFTLRHQPEIFGLVLHGGRGMFLPRIARFRLGEVNGIESFLGSTVHWKKPRGSRSLDSEVSPGQEREESGVIYGACFVSISPCRAVIILHETAGVCPLW